MMNCISIFAKMKIMQTANTSKLPNLQSQICNPPSRESKVSAPKEIYFSLAKYHPQRRPLCEAAVGAIFVPKPEPAFSWCKEVKHLAQYLFPKDRISGKKRYHFCILKICLIILLANALSLIHVTYSTMFLIKKYSLLYDNYFRSFCPHIGNMRCLKQKRFQKSPEAKCKIFSKVVDIAKFITFEV